MRRLPALALVLLAIGIAIALLPEPLRTALECERNALAAGEWWRAWSGHVVHFSARHAAVDLAAAFALAAGIEMCCGHRALAAMMLYAPPLLSLALYFSAPELAVYRGASGLCAAFATILGLVLWKESPAMHAPLIALAGLFALKTWCEATGFAANVSGLDEGVRVVWQAHAFGAVLGAGAFALWSRDIDCALFPTVRTA
ncbi:rhombosortase [Rudaea sp.]|uniref:rhombosortase n=1 Tax=Rudaea sp. TaxID=2136325 RepID=UPI002ED2EE1B